MVLIDLALTRGAGRGVGTYPRGGAYSMNLARGACYDLPDFKPKRTKL